MVDVPLKRGLRRGEVLWGRVVSVEKEGAWVDIGAKSEGFIPLQEMKSRSKTPLEVDEEVLVQVIEPPRPEGEAILSLDRARRFQVWYELERSKESGATIEAMVTSVNKGGLLVHYQGVRGFVPLSQLLGNRNHNLLKEYVGRNLKLKVLDLDQKQGRLILSYKAVVEEERARVLSGLKEGDVIRGKVTGVHSFGLFVDIGGVEGLVPASELSWEGGAKPEEAAQIGQEVEVKVLKVDTETGKLVLSIKRTTPHPWETVAERYQEGQYVTGTVVRFLPFGAIVRLDGAIEAMAHISELSRRRINHPKEAVKLGQVLKFKVLKVDKEKRRMRLSLRQVDEEG